MTNCLHLFNDQCYIAGAENTAWLPNDPARNSRESKDAAESIKLCDKDTLMKLICGHVCVTVAARRSVGLQSECVIYY